VWEGRRGEERREGGKIYIFSVMVGGVVVVVVVVVR